MTHSVPEYHSHEEFRNRSQKLKEIRELGIDPFPPKFTPDAKAQDLINHFEGQPVGDSEAAQTGSTPITIVAGRMVLFRAMGKNAFAHVQDDSGRIQVMFNRDCTEVVGLPHSDDPEALKPMKFIEKKLDLGDIIGVEGHLFRTHKGELTLFAKKVTLLCKSLLPLPDKHSGLADKGTRYRKRWLDLIVNQDVANTLRLRSRVVQLVRRAFEKEGFLEVETPILENTYGGAQARPFLTHLNSLDQEMFLRISLEIPLKKLIIGGMDKVYELSKVFRNEGIDKTHNPEFTMVEAYASYWDYKDMMVFTENLFASIALELFGTTKITLTNDNNESCEIDLKTPWKRLSMKDSIKEYASMDVDQMSDDEMRKKLLSSGEFEPKEVQSLTRGALIAKMFETYAESHLIQPHHIIDHPIETTPLCKLHRDPELRKQRFVERFETFIMGREFCNSYSELNDPELQRELLVQQNDMRNSGDEEANPLDEEFIEAICQGMPPTGGLGIGIDRLVMLFCREHSIRDVLYFPLMRPED